MGKVTGATAANTSISKVKTATYSALPKTADSNTGIDVVNLRAYVLRRGDCSSGWLSLFILVTDIPGELFLTIENDCEPFNL